LDCCTTGASYWIQLFGYTRSITNIASSAIVHSVIGNFVTIGRTSDVK